MKFFKIEILVFLLLNLKINAMQQEEAVARECFMSFMQNVEAGAKDFDDSILSKLRNSLKIISRPSFDTHKVAMQFAIFADNLLTMFDEQTPCNSMQYLGVEIKNFEEFYYRINEICNYEKHMFIGKLQQSNPLLQKITQISEIDMRLRHQLRSKYTNLITRIRLLSIIKYGLLGDDHMMTMYTNFFTHGLAILERLNRCNNTFALDQALQEINKVIIVLDFLS